MKRQLLLFIASVLSVVAFLNVCLWCRSSVQTDVLVVELPSRVLKVLSREGQMDWELTTWVARPPGQYVGLCDNEPPRGIHLEHADHSSAWYLDSRTQPALGVSLKYLTAQPNASYARYTTDHVELKLANWLVLALTLAPLVLIVWRLAAGARPRTDQCAACDYDVRASVGKCPECGAPIDAMITSVTGIAPGR